MNQELETISQNVASNGINANRDCNACVHQLFERHAAKSPNAVAVQSGNVRLSYGELNERAERLARQLRAIGVGPESVVGLRASRSRAMIVGALGILKAGGAYLPLDAAEPEGRARLMLDDAQVPVLVTEAAAARETLKRNRHLVVLDEDGEISGKLSSTESELPAARIRSSNLAYVIYTSGSTGTPKGVEVTHENLSNLVSWHQEVFDVTETDRASCVARVGFDACVWEIWPYLAAGASLHLPDEDLLSDPEAFQSWLIEQRISICFAPTPMAERLLALDWLADGALRLMLTGGDTLHRYPPPDLPFLLINNYGPTECTVVATSGAVCPEQSDGYLPPIGRTIHNCEIYILDESLRPVPKGTTGEIYIGGLGVARGYRNHPELTAEKFVENPLGKGWRRLFKTGDCGRYLADGQIEFFGRVDDQVKIRGFRIEPGEIAAALNQHPAISQSAVVARDSTAGELQLVAYLVPAPDVNLALNELREFAGARLPAYMVPVTFVRLDALPTTPNGKVDRSALPAPGAGNTISGNSQREPQTEIEEIVAGILAELLGIEHVDAEANFFALGGHSLLGIQLISRVRERLDVELSLRTVFESPSVVELSAAIEQLLLQRLEAMSEDEVQRNLNPPEQVGS